MFGPEDRHSRIPQSSYYKCCLFIVTALASLSLHTVCGVLASQHGGSGLIPCRIFHTPVWLEEKGVGVDPA